MNKNLKIIPKIFIFVGLCFFIISLSFFIYQQQFIKNGEKTIGTIIQLDYYKTNNNHIDYLVIVEYIVNNQQYKTRLNSYNSTMYEGQQIELYYLSNNPHKILTNNILLILIFFIVSLVLFTIAFFIEFKFYKIKLKNKRLKTYGMIINAKITKIDINYNVKINNLYPYKISAIYEEDNKIYNFISHNIWNYNFIDYLINNNIEYINIYVNPKNFKDYLICDS